MLKENNIRGCLHYNRPELVDVLVKRGLIPEIIKITTSTSLPERQDTKKEINPKYNFLKHIRNSPKIWKQVKLLYKAAMYKAAKRFNQQSRLIYAYDGKVSY